MRARTRRGRTARAPRGASLAALVAGYVADIRPEACARLAFYANQASLAAALEVVAAWRDEHGRVEVRQSRLGRAVREAAAARIRALSLADAVTFATVHSRVEAALGGLRGLGELAVYDVALRLGAVLGLPPQAVFLARGVQAAARVLGVPRARWAAIDAFPAEMRRLHAWEVENFLRLNARRLALDRRARPAA